VQRKLLLFDWDKTIQEPDSTWPFKNRVFKSLIKAKQKAGWYIGLNSDTPYDRLFNWYSQLGMNGPILAEKGLVIGFPGLLQMQPIVRTEQLFSEIRLQLIQRLSQKNDVTFYMGDNVDFVRKVRYIPPGRPIFVALDAYRMCSLGLIVCNVEKSGQLQIGNGSAWDEIHQLVADTLPDNPLIGEMDTGGRYGGFIGVTTQGAAKRNGLAALYRQWPFDRVVMVGDSLPDYMDLHQALRNDPVAKGVDWSCVPQVEHYAVANAHEDYFNIEDVTLLNKTYLDGCIEFLERLES
jgi:hydroxymethylpyrimidine pyrophosphatase-like HAD family hydrolase